LVATVLGVAGLPAHAEAAPGSPAAANLPEVQMTCAAGQTDINFASVDELKAALGVNTPVAQRVVSWRPYLQPKDLLVVEGIGPGKLPSILASNKTCATPTSYPPPSGDACVDDRVDLAAASVDEIAKRLGVAQPIAQRIVNARPYASLKHVTPERVAGVGKGTLDNVVAKSCLTPAPIRSSVSSWRWAYSSQTTTVQRDKYALKVPAGVIDNAGGWASIEPRDHSVSDVTPAGTLSTGDWPTADFHISAPWAGGGDTVSETLPQDPFIAAANDPMQPLVVHYKSDGSTETFTGDSVRWDQTAGTVSVRLTSLSESQSSSYSPGWFVEKALGFLFNNRFDGPHCSEPWHQVAGTSTYEGPAGDTVNFISAVLDLPGNQSFLGSFPFKFCVQTPNGSADAETKLRNNTGAISFVKPMYSGSPVSITQESDPSGVFTDLLGFVITGALNLTHPGQAYLAPGQTASFFTPIRSTRVVNAQPDRVSTAFYTAFRIGIGPLLDKFTSSGTNLSDATTHLLTDGVACIYQKLGVFTSPADATFNLTKEIKDCLDLSHLVDLLRADLSARFRAGAIPGNVFNQASLDLKNADHFRCALKVLDVGLAATDTVLWSNVNGQVVSAQHLPAKPTVDANGNPVLDRCLKLVADDWKLNQTCQDAAYAFFGGGGPGIGTTDPGGTGATHPLSYAKVIVRDPSNGEATLFDIASRTTEFIDDGGTYLCLAAKYPVDYQPTFSMYRGTILVLPRASCDSSVPAVSLTPDTVPEHARVLRDSAGHAWYIIGGHRQSIPTGAEFNCWASGDHGNADVLKTLVWDDVPGSVIDAFPQDPPDAYFPCIQQQPTF
jgi:DNA uptake protein ComE-like DNA-binding protein